MRSYKPLTDEQKLRRHLRHKAWCQKNRDKRRASGKKYRENNPESCKQQRINWVSKNQEKLKAYRKQYREAHRDVLNKQCMEYYYDRYYSDPDYKNKIISQTKKWSQNNKDKRREIYNRWRRNNLRHCALKMSKRRATIKNGKVCEKGIEVFIARLRSCATINCYYCRREIASGDAHIDHILPICKGGPHSMSNICAACPACNFSKNRQTLEKWPKTGQMFLNF